MVAVSGEADPATILVTIAKLKIRTELVSYKDPRAAQKKKQAQRLKNTQNHHHHPKAKDTKKIIDHHNDHNHDHSNSDSDSDDQIDGDDHGRRHKIKKPANVNDPFVAPHGKGNFPKPKPLGPKNNWARGMYGRPPPGPPPAFPLPPWPPMPPHAYGGYGHHSSMAPLPRPPPHAYGGNGHHSSMAPLPRPPPPLQMYPYPYYHRTKEPPVGNSMLHYFSDDNTSSSACTIM
ncbi:hypothetical protein PRUPE_8G245500 [Prunus persica]|uniref:HMA domain-containing protein n=1 Tax=Prunus persica TaxID=3760 RepID=A0A251N2V9_PRUPE|nr:basic proline-rich protein [Prunus persica]ONH93668.1 hypothetical protein PRUPE_8G245500 [Prunus persica]